MNRIAWHGRGGGIVAVALLLTCAARGGGQTGVEARCEGRQGPVKATLRHDGAKVWLDGVEPHCWLERCNSIMNSLTVALRAVGEDITYEFLMGASGAAFRVQILPGAPCPCAPHAKMGYHCADRAVAATGYGLEWLAVDRDDPESLARARAAAARSITEGCPVLWSGEECSVLLGYVEGTDQVLGRSYWDEKVTEQKDWPWEIGLLSKRDQPPDRRAVLLGSLETAVELANAGLWQDGRMQFLVGFPAYRKWIQYLLDDEHWQTVNEGRPKPDHGNAWCWDNLVSARAAAAAYLRAIAGDFAGATEEHLIEAADLYQQMAQEVLRSRDERSVAPYPWAVKEGEYWTQERRHTEAALLKQAMGMERKAVAEIEQALAATGQM